MGSTLTTRAFERSASSRSWMLRWIGALRFFLSVLRDKFSARGTGLAVFFCGICVPARRLFFILCVLSVLLAVGGSSPVCGDSDALLPGSDPSPPPTLLTPVPEPRSAVLLLTSVAVILILKLSWLRAFSKVCFARSSLISTIQGSSRPAL